MATVSQLIDYLQQFKGSHRVACDADDMENPYDVNLQVALAQIDGDN